MALGTSWTQIASQGFTYLGYSGTAYVYAKLNSQDVANNRSKIDLQLRIYHSVWVQSYDTDFYLSGYGWLGYAYRSFDSGTTTIMSSQITVNHNADGTGSFTATGGYEYKGIGINATQFTSSSQSLPTIPRASVPSASPNPITIGNGTNTLTVNTNRKSSSFTHTVRIQVGSWSAQNTSVGSSTTFNIPYSVIAQFSATSKTATGTITCTTYSGSTNIGQKTASFTLQVNTGVDHPNIGAITLTEGNPQVAAVITAPDTFVQGISTLQLSAPITVSGSYTELSKATVSNGSDLQTYTLTGTSQTITYTSAEIRTTWLTVTAYDKRGTTAVSKPAWTLLQYAPLTATATVGRPSATGSTAVGQVTGVAYGGTYDSTPNSLTITYEWKLHTDNTWTPGQDTFTRSLSAGSQTYTEAVTFAEAFDYRNEYDIRFTVADLFSSATYTCRLTQGLPIISWDETEVDVFGDLHIHDRDNPYNYQDVMQGFDGVLAHGGQKNYYAQFSTRTNTGVTFTAQADGSYKVTGSSTDPSTWGGYANTLLTAGDYILSGGNSHVSIMLRDSGGSYVGESMDGAEFNFTVPQDAIYRCYLVVRSGYTVNDTIYPMIRDARLASTAFTTPVVRNAHILVGSGDCYYSQVGKIVTVTGTIGGSTMAQYTKFVDSLPKAVTNNAVFYATNNNNASYIPCYLDSDGWITNRTAISGSYSLRFMFSYIAI